MGDTINLNLHPSNQLHVDLLSSSTSKINLRTPTSIIIADYNELKNLPSLNGVTIKGDLTYVDLFLAKESTNTKEYWDLNPLYIPENGEIVIYLNRTVIDNVTYPGIKIGDGNSYLVDLPFLGDNSVNMLTTLINNHINDTTVHVTDAERSKWNNKLNYQVKEEEEELIFNNN